MNDMLALAAFALGFSASGAIICGHMAWKFKDRSWLWLGSVFLALSLFIGFGHSIFDLFKI